MKFQSYGCSLGNAQSQFDRWGVVASIDVVITSFVMSETLSCNDSSLRTVNRALDYPLRYDATILNFFLRHVMFILQE